MWYITVLLIILIAGALGIPALVKRSRTPKQAGGTSPSPSIWSKFNTIKWKSGDFLMWWVAPMACWIVLNWTIWYYFNPLWQALTCKMILFLAIQVSHLVILYRSNNILSASGTKVQPMYPSVIGIVMFLFIGAAYIGGDHQEERSYASRSVGQATTVARTSQHAPVTQAHRAQATKAAQPTKAAEPVALPPIDVTVMVYPVSSKDVREVNIPEGYYVAQGAWQQAAFIETKEELADKSVDMTFVSKNSKAVEVTITLIPNEK